MGRGNGNPFVSHSRSRWPTTMSPSSQSTATVEEGVQENLPVNRLEKEKEKTKQKKKQKGKIK